MDAGWMSMVFIYECRLDVNGCLRSSFMDAGWMSTNVYGLLLFIKFLGAMSYSCIVKKDNFEKWNCCNVHGLT